MTQAPPAVPELDALIEAADYVIDSYMRLWRGQVVRDLAEAEEAYSAAKDAAFGARHRTQALTAGAGDYVLMPREATQDMCDDATEVIIDDGKGGHTALNWSEAAAVYRAMLAAAPAPQPASEREVERAERIVDSVAEALASIGVAYTHNIGAHLEHRDHSWKVHTVVSGENPFDRNEWLGEFDNKADAHALAAKLRREAAILAALRHGEQGHG